MFTGTDEHGQKVERAAQAVGKSPQEFTDAISAEFRTQWEKLNIRVDRTIRTTDPRHHRTVQTLFQRCLDNGYIYKGSYTGQYCVYDELYVNDAKPGDPCPECGRPTETVTEENYFFKLSAFPDRLLELYEDQPDFIQPETRRNEVLSFVRQGLQRSLHQPHDHQVGHPAAGRRPSRLLRLVRRAHHVHDAPSDGEEPLARRPASDRQRDRPLPRHLLARVPDGRRPAAARSASSPTAGCCLKTTR